MLGLEVAAAIVVAQVYEDMAFEKGLGKAPFEVAQKLRAERRARQEIARIEALEGRRHRELCDAIRSAGFWSFLR